VCQFANGFVAACKVRCESCLTSITKLLKGFDGYCLHVSEYGFVATWQQTEVQPGAVAFIGPGVVTAVMIVCPSDGPTHRKSTATNVEFRNFGVGPLKPSNWVHRKPAVADGWILSVTEVRLWCLHVIVTT